MEISAGATAQQWQEAQDSRATEAHCSEHELSGRGRDGEADKEGRDEVEQGAGLRTKELRFTLEMEGQNTGAGIRR